MRMLVTIFIVLLMVAMLSESCKADVGWSTIPRYPSIGKTKYPDEVRVMVIDTGVDYEHPMLNKFIDFMGLNLDPESYKDHHGHGTHVTGIILYGNEMYAHPTTDQYGFKHHGFNSYDEVCRSVHILSCKYFDPTNKSNDNLKHTVECVRKAIEMKVDVINYSGGGTEPNENEYNAFKDFIATGGTVVVAAGNEHESLVKKPYYPASYAIFPDKPYDDYTDNEKHIEQLTARLKFARPSLRGAWVELAQTELTNRLAYKKFLDEMKPLERLYVVENLDNEGKVIRSSNYHPLAYKEVGLSIFSTLPGGNFGLMTGTSQSTPALLHKMLKQKCLEALPWN